MTSTVSHPSVPSPIHTQRCPVTSSTEVFQGTFAARNACFVFLSCARHYTKSLHCKIPHVMFHKVYRTASTQSLTVELLQCFFCSMALMRDCVRRANFTTKPRLKAKFFAFALFMRGYSFQLYYPGNSFMQNFATLCFENETWW